MANSNKHKGDRAEREALDVLCRLAPDLVVLRPQRLLGAGRREDTGDLWVLPGVTVQVKARADPAHPSGRRRMPRRCRLCAPGTHSDWGWCPSPRARCGSVRRVACGISWPQTVPTTVFGSVPAALQHVRRDDGAARPRVQRVAVVHRSGTAAVLLGSLESWLTA